MTITNYSFVGPNRKTGQCRKEEVSFCQLNIQTQISFLYGGA